MVDLPTGTAMTYSRQYRRCGKPGCSTCRPGATGHGPYWYAYWHEGGRTRSRYLGKEAPPGATASTALNSAQHPAPPTALRVRTLGGFAVRRGERLIPPERWARRGAADLCKLLLGAPGYRLHREQIVEVLWPETDPVEAGTRLRTAIYLLRRILDDPEGSNAPPRPSYLRSEAGFVRLAPTHEGEPDVDWLDATAFAEAARIALAGRDVGACRAALALYSGEYLPEDVYADWSALRREKLRAQHIALLLHLAALDAEDGENAAAERLLREVLGADPCHEEAAQRLMALLAVEGRRGEALHVYSALAIALRDDLALRPARATEAIHTQILQDAAPQAADRAPALDAHGATGTVPPNNLPDFLSPFIGREHDLAAVADLLSGHRLLTLVGTGGCGKTRLALRLAADSLPLYPDGVWLVEFAAQQDPALVPGVVAKVLGLHTPTGAEGGQSGLDALVTFLQPRHLLLVLDNCEHLVDACASLATALLAACPALRILATSREALRVAGETVWRVPSLSLPASAYRSRLEELPRYDAVQFFVERARLSRPDFALSAENAATVVQICRRLDGIPLALELAAARLNVLSVTGLAARLDDCFRVLIGGSRSALPRQQTLRATMDWGYELLDARERVLLRRLAVFAGGWTLEAAENVCIGIVAPRETVLDLLSYLARTSWLTVTEEHDDVRYSLLETVRQYAAGHLVAEDEAAALRLRHLEYYLALVERALAAWSTAADQAALDLLHAEHDNLQAALAWAGDGDGDPADGRRELGLRLAVALCPFWEVRGYLSEGRHALYTLLQVAGTAPPALRGAALNAAGNLAYRQGDYDRATALLTDALALRRVLGDRRGTAICLNNLGLVADEQGDLARAAALFTESLTLKQEIGDQRGVAHSLTNLGRVAHHQGDLARAAALHEQSLDLLRWLGDHHNVARSLNNLAMVEQEQGDDERATALLQESVAIKQMLGDRQGIAASLILLGRIAIRHGDDRHAAATLQESLEISRDLADQAGSAAALRELAGLA